MIGAALVVVVLLLRTIEANMDVPALRRASLPTTPLLAGLLRPR